MSYTYKDLAKSTAASVRSTGGNSLTVAPGTGSLFGAPTNQAPMRLVVYRSETFVTILSITGRTGDVLAISGTDAGYADAAVQIGDVVANVPTAADFTDLWEAIADISLTPGPQGDPGPAGADGAQGPQGNTGATGATGAKGDKGDTGATGATGPAGVGSFGVSMPSGFSVANSPLTGSGTIAVTTTLSGILKGTGSGVTAATAGTDYVVPAAIASKADDSAVVHLAGAEAVTGRKTMTSPTAKSDGTNPALALADSGGAAVGGFDVSGYGFVEKATFLLGVGEDLTTGTNKTRLGVIAGANGKLWKVKVQANTNGGSGGFSFDIKRNGTSIFSAPQSVAVSTTTVQSFNTFASATVSEGDVFTVDVTSVGSGVQDVNVTLFSLVRNA